jgi:outer membrane protein
MRKIFLLLLMPVVNVTAQLPEENGIRYADVEYIFSQLPAAKQIESELRSLHTQLENKIKVQHAEFEKKYAIYAKTAATDPMRASLEKELQTMQENIQKLKKNSDVLLQQKQLQLMEPVTKNIQKAIADVAIENNFSFILMPALQGGIWSCMPRAKWTFLI